MVQIMGFWPILTIFWSDLQKFKSRILRVECFLGAIKNGGFSISLENCYIKFEPDRTKSRKVQGGTIQNFAIFRGVRPHEFLVIFSQKKPMLVKVVPNRDLGVFYFSPKKISFSPKIEG